jgi:CBS-domain-containing membrane protein
MNDDRRLDHASGRRRRIVFPWRLFDVKFKHNRARYLYQSLMAMATMMAVLPLLDAVAQTVLIASLGASSFIAFAMPHVHASKPRYLIGGYLVGTAVGCSLSLLATLVSAQTSIDYHTLQILCGAAAAGLAFLLMVVTDTEHPPAASLALGYVLNEWSLLTVVVVLTGLVAIVGVKESTKRLMIDLV